MRSTSILIKPASSMCNLVCTYCFYDDVSNCRDNKSFGYMKDDVWKKLVEESLDPSLYDEITFAFQGGEPMLAPRLFYEKFITYVDSLKKDIIVNYAIQTNGSMINDKWCHFFVKHNFLVGISIDGFAENHNRLRMINGNGSHERVMDGMRKLKEHKIDFNVLSVLTKHLSKEPTKLYEFYQENDFRFIQLIECMPSFTNTVEEDIFACSPRHYYSFYSEFYELWKTELYSGVYRSIGLFDDIIRIFNNQRPIQCGRLGSCSMQCVVEADGSVYPCDFYVLDEYNLGNLTQEPMKKIIGSPIIDTFRDHDQGLPDFCKTCPFMNVCGGGCKRMRSTFLGEDFCGYQNLLMLFMNDIEQITNTIVSLNN